MDFIKNFLNQLPNLNDYTLGIFSILVFVGRFFGGLKYHIQSVKIRRLHTAQSQSRMLINMALVADSLLLLWVVLHLKDTVLFLAVIVTLIFELELFWVTYKYYPYKYRKLNNFKRPNILKYLYNSLLPNTVRHKL